MNKGFRKFR